MSKIKIGTIKADTPTAQPHEIPEVEKHQKVASDWRYTVHTIITPDQGPRESTMLQLSKMHLFFFIGSDRKNKTTNRLRPPCSHRPLQKKQPQWNQWKTTETAELQEMFWDTET